MKTLTRAAAIVLLLVIGGCRAREVLPERAIVRSVSVEAAAEPESAAPACRSEWRLLDAGLRHRSHCEEGTAALHLVEIDPTRWALAGARVSPATASAVAQARGARFAINANFFDQERKALGLIVSGGERLQGVHPVSWQSIFYTTAGGESGIVLPREWASVEARAAMAVQAGPRLVAGGKRTNAARATPSARSGVCLATGRRAVFFVTAGATLYDVQELAALAALDEDEGGLGCRDAMLFDGGPSAQMHLEESGVSIDGDLVPAFVLGFPRTARSPERMSRVTARAARRPS